MKVTKEVYMEYLAGVTIGNERYGYGNECTDEVFYNFDLCTQTFEINEEVITQKYLDTHSISSIRDFFAYEYVPTKEDLITGLKYDTYWFRVLSDYLTAMVESMEVIECIMVNTKGISTWIASKAKAEEMLKGHTFYHYPMMCDLLMLGKTDNAYYFIWSDSNKANCAIGMFHKSKFESDEVIIEVLKRSVKNLYYYYPSGAEYIELPIALHYNFQ